MILRPYQQSAYNDIIAILESGGKSVMYQLLTGGGKTALVSHIIKHSLIRKKRVFFVCDREELIEQSHKTFQKLSMWGGIIKAGYPIQTKFLLQVCSIQTLINRPNLPVPALIIFDEAHGSQPDNSYGLILRRYPKARLIGLTATPTRMSGHGFTDMYEKLILGPKYQEMVDGGYLSPVKHMVCSVPDLSEVNINSTGEYNEEEAYQAMATAPYVESYMENTIGDKSLITFAINIKHSKLIEKKYNDASLEMVHLDANTNEYDRKRIISRLKKGDLKRICNVGILTKGFDYPELECIQLARPTKSLSLYLQMIGRVYRVAPGKSHGLILDNAGCGFEHGPPWMDHDWTMHFTGFKKKRRTKVQDMIEIVEFEYEDGDGHRRKTELPNEVEGMKLIDIKTIIKKKYVNVLSLKEFDNKLFMFTAMKKKGKKIKSPGYAATKAYMDFCRKKHYHIDENAWQYIKNKVCIEPDKSIQGANMLLFELENKSNGMDPNLKRLKVDQIKKDLSKFKLIKTNIRWIEGLEKKYSKEHSKMNFKQ